MTSLTRALALMTVAAAALLSGAAQAQSTLERIKAEQVIRIGFANEAPFGFVTADGTLTGEAPEIARVILERIDPAIEMEPVVVEFGSLIPGLLADRFDVIAAGMFVRPARCEQIAFSAPTYGLGEAFMVTAGNPKNLHSFEDVANNPNAVLAVVSGGAEQSYAEALGVPADRLQVYTDNPSGMAAVLTGQADAFALTSLAIQSMIETAQNPALERAADFIDPVIDGASVRGYGAFGFRKEDADLRAAFDAVLAEYVGSPEHLALVAPFGLTAAELPGDVTTAELCAPN